MGKDTIRDVQSGREGKKALCAVYLIIYRYIAVALHASFVI